MRPDNRLKMQQEAVALTRAGSYEKAVTLLEVALDGSTGVIRANILRDLADAERRIEPVMVNLAKAQQHLQESLKLLNQNTHPIEWASTVHFVARLKRQQGQLAATPENSHSLYFEGLREVDCARLVIETANANRLAAGQPAHPEQIFILLDQASLSGLLAAPHECRRFAKEALQFAKRHPAPEITRAHISRARILRLFASKPDVPWKRVHQAFYGSTEPQKSSATSIRS